MKICAIICEYNPFHNGHKYLLERARELSGCDALLCIMSASFTQRGEAAILPKFVRAEHAINGGADCVIQLPAAFSAAPAEIFAQGAVSILKSIPAVTHLAFGCELADESAIKRAAETFLNAEKDDAEMGKLISKHMSGGQSYKRSVALSLEELGADGTLAASPNGVLAIEYARAIKKSGSNIGLVPVLRIGGGYGDTKLKENFSSASAIRTNLNDGAVANNVPDYVFRALKEADFNGVDGRADALLRYSLRTANKNDMARIFGCTEGLENKLKSDADLTMAEIIAGATNRRYTSSRIRRILTANMLEIYSDDVIKYIGEGTYIKPLAVRKDRKDEIFCELSKSVLPVIIKKMSLKALGKPAQKCYDTDLKADFARALIYGVRPEYEYTVKLVQPQ